MIPSRRATSSRHTSTESAIDLASGDAPIFFSFLAISWRWIVSELSGLPSSWATPAARRRMDEVLSSSIRCAVVILSRVTSARITAWRGSPTRSPSGKGTM